LEIRNKHIHISEKAGKWLHFFASSVAKASSVSGYSAHKRQMEHIRLLSFALSKVLVPSEEHFATTLTFLRLYKDVLIPYLQISDEDCQFLF
jgi:hypothetical protein